MRSGELNKPNRTPYLKWAVACISITLYAVSLSQTAFYVDYQDHKFSSIACLLWSALYLDHTFAWLRNITLPAAIFLLFVKNQTGGLVPSLLTIALMLSFLAEKTAVVNESGAHARIIGYAAGYWLWTASAAVIFADNIFTPYKAKYDDRKPTK